VDKLSADHEAMLPYWTDVSNVMGGIRAMRDARKLYLHKFAAEDEVQYDARHKLTRMTNVFTESASTLAAKPFQEPIRFQNESLPDEIDQLQHNIDGRGNNLTVFASQIFLQGMVNGIHWVLVDNPVAPQGPITVAEARDRGMRPYWVHVPAHSVLEVKSEMSGGVEVLSHVRILEQGETKRVRVFNRDLTVVTGSVTWELWEEQESKDRKLDTEWVKIDGGTLGIERIPLIPYITGMRQGASWVITPPLRDAIDLQIELYIADSGVKHLETTAAYPMLSAAGVKAPKNADGKIEATIIGPMRVLYAEPDGTGNHGEWKYIEPSGESLRLLIQQCKEMEGSLRELMRQPLTVNSENLTVITTSVAAGKTKTLVGAWRLLLMDMLNEAFILTGKWMGVDFDPDVFVFKDFDEFLESKDLAELAHVRDTGEISRRTYWKELVRRGLLSSDFVADKEEAALLAEVPPDPLTNGEDNALEDQ
jgi:hypothetical protein